MIAGVVVCVLVYRANCRGIVARCRVLIAGFLFDCRVFVWIAGFGECGV